MRIWIRSLVSASRTEFSAQEHQGNWKDPPARGPRLRRCAAIIGVALLTWLTGCASTQRANGVQPSGFLGEYASLLRPVGEDNAGLFFRDPNTNWPAYRRILLEPVTIWGDSTTALSNGQGEDLQQLADSFYHTLAMKLSKDYTLVDAPVSGTMRIQAAISYGMGPRTEPMLASRVISQRQTASSLWTFASKKPSLAGEVAIEFLVKDARTGSLLAAGIDRRGAGRTLFGKQPFDSWQDVRDGVESWIDASLYRLCLLRGGPNCVRPRE